MRISRKHPPIKGRVCGRLQEVVNFKNRSTGGPFLVTGLQGVKTMENHKTASPTSGHGCLQEGFTYERFLSQGFEWENFGVFHRWSLMGGGRSWEEVVHGGWPVIGYYRRGLSPSAQPPSWRPRGLHLGWSLPFEFFGMNGSTLPSWMLCPPPLSMSVNTLFVAAIWDP